jgi:hypothetical protein
MPGCKKHSFDYRNKFLGDYTFSVHFSSWIYQTSSFDTTYISDGNIWYGNDAHSVKISISEETSFEFTIYEDGTLGPMGYGEGYNEGEFESTKKVKFYWTFGGLGGRTNYVVTGERK